MLPGPQPDLVGLDESKEIRRGRDAFLSERTAPGHAHDDFLPAPFLHGDAADREVVEELIGQQDGMRERLGEFRRVRVAGEPCGGEVRVPLAGGLAALDEVEPQRGTEFFPLLGTEDGACEVAPPRPELDDVEGPFPEAEPFLVDEASDTGPKEGRHLDARKEVSVATRAVRAARIVAALGIVEHEVHELVEPERPVAPGGLEELSPHARLDLGHARRTIVGA